MGYHELAHAVLRIVIDKDKHLLGELRGAYDLAKGNEFWETSDPIDYMSEYWAAGVTAYFSVYWHRDEIQIQRGDLQNQDEKLFDLIDGFFNDELNWKPECPE